MPKYLSDHIDYITPGLRLLAPSPPNADENEVHQLEKRTFGITKGSGFLPPILKPLPGLLATLLELPLDSLCTVAITPGCIRGNIHVLALR